MCRRAPNEQILTRFLPTSFEVEKLRERIGGALNWTKEDLPPRFQFNGFECAQLVADTYKRLVVILEEDTNRTAFPTTFIPLVEPRPDPSRPNPLPIVFRYTLVVGIGHYDLFKVEEPCMFPAIHTMYTRIGMDIAERTSSLQQVHPIAEPVAVPPVVIDLLDDFLSPFPTLC